MFLRLPYLLYLSLVLAVPGLSLVLAVPALALPKKPEPAAHAGPAANAPKEIGRFDSWIAATHEEGGTKVCYALTRAESSTPKLPDRGEVVLTVSQRPTARDIVAIEAGFDYPPNAAVTVQVDQTGLDFYTRQQDAYARDGKAAVAAFHKGARVIARSPGPRGQQVTDAFSLKGFSAAYTAIVKACPEKK